MDIRPVDLPADRSRLLEFLSSRSSDLSENKHAFVALADGRPGMGLVAEGDGTIVGYVGLAPAGGRGEWAMEMAFDPDRASVEGMVSAAGAVTARRGGRRLRWWVYDPDQEPLPPRHGFEPERELLLMGRPLPAEAAPEWKEFSVSGFHPGLDERQWLAVNNAAFAGHPENGDITAAELQRRMRMEWFEPDGVRMAWRDGRLAGFCWTKVHGSKEGEIYIIGVHPDFQGKGLGKALVEEGMRHLADKGCPRVFLYTEGDNQAAVGLYRTLGFEIERVHRSFIRELTG